jgi:hypothetical protein
MEGLMIPLIAVCDSLILILCKTRKFLSFVTLPTKLKVSNLLAKVNATPHKQKRKNINASGNFIALLI